jgi:hypothetical protein
VSALAFAEESYAYRSTRHDLVSTCNGFGYILCFVSVRIVLCTQSGFRGTVNKEFPILCSHCSCVNSEACIN